MGLDPVDQRGFGPRENEVYGVLEGKLDERWEIANADIDIGDIRKVVGGPPVSCTIPIQLNSIQFNPIQDRNCKRSRSGIDPPGAT